MRKVSYSLVESAPVQFREANVFPIHATRHNLHPEVTRKFDTHSQRVREAAEEKVKAMNDPVKPCNHFEIMGRVMKEMSDYVTAVQNNDIHKAKAEFFDMEVNIFILNSTSDHIINID